MPILFPCVRSLSSNFDPQQLSYNLALVPVGPARNYFTVYCLNFSLLLCLNISVMGKLQAEYCFAQEDSSKYPSPTYIALAILFTRVKMYFLCYFVVHSITEKFPCITRPQKVTCYLMYINIYERSKDDTKLLLA